MRTILKIRYKNNWYDLLSVSDGSELFANCDFGLPSTNIDITPDKPGQKITIYLAYTSNPKVSVLVANKKVEYIADIRGKALEVYAERTLPLYGFTGRILIAGGETYNRRYHPEGTSSYLDADAAYELYFEKGIFREEIDMDEELKSWSDLMDIFEGHMEANETVKEGYDRFNESKYAYPITEGMGYDEFKDHYARTRLKYEYI